MTTSIDVPEGFFRVRHQIDALELDSEKPAIVCDADEVLLQFIGHLEKFIISQGLRLDLQSYRLTGNIKTPSGRPLGQPEVDDLLDRFYRESTAHMEPVEDAASSLAELANHAQIVVLTNLRHEHRANRIASLNRHGMHYPVITNEGHKGPAIRYLAERIGNQIFFIDDSPFHLDSAKQSWAATHCLHFVADCRLQRFAQDWEMDHPRFADWPNIRSHILRELGIVS